MNSNYEEIYVAYGPLHAETVRLMLEAAGFHVITRQESAGAAIGLTVGALGEVKVLVPVEEAAQARKMVEDMEEGRLGGGIDDEDVDSESTGVDPQTD